MAGKVKPGISFYRMDSGHIRDPKVRLLCNEFDSDGYLIWHALIDYGYLTWGYYFDTNNKEELELFASEYCKKKLSLVREVIAGCIRRDLFDKVVYDSFGILTIDIMQEVFLYATADRRKKGSVFQMQENWLLIDFKDEIPRNIEVIPGNIKKLPGKDEQTKQNGKQTKTETEKRILAPAKQSPAKNSVPKLKEETEQHWQILVDAWFKFNQQKLGNEPSFKDRDPKLFKKIIQLLKHRAGKKNIEWTQENALASLNYFLGIAYGDKWLSEHFLLENLSKQFDAVYSREQKKTVPVIANKSSAPVSQSDIDYMIERFYEGSLDNKLITPSHYDFLLQAGKISSSEAIMQEAKRTRAKQLEGANKAPDIRLMGAYQENKETPETIIDLPVLERIYKRLSVLYYFTQLKTAHAAVK